MAIYDIELKDEDHGGNDIGTYAYAELHEMGVTHIRLVEEFGDHGESTTTIYAYPAPSGYELKFATTNGFPIWESDDDEWAAHMEWVKSPEFEALAR